MILDADVNVRDHSGKKPMQYLVRQDTTVSMDTFKSESKNAVVLRERIPSAASSPLHYRRSRAFSTNTPPSSYSEQQGYLVSLPTCNSASNNNNNQVMSPYSSGPASRPSSPTPSSTSQILTGQVTLTSFLKRRPSNASIFKYPPISPIRKTESLSGSTSSLNEQASSRHVQKSASFMSPFKNMDDMRRSFRQGVKQMWNGYPKQGNK